MKGTYKTYQARNAVKAALVTNHIKARKKVGITHGKAKAEAYQIHGIKAALPILRGHFEEFFAYHAIVDKVTRKRASIRTDGLATTPPKELFND